ncbi:MAG: hypothetical protein ACRDYA_22925 [Egibacteraceae bacterium]
MPTPTSSKTAFSNADSGELGVALRYLPFLLFAPPMGRSSTAATAEG